jgi:hypothetical protein
MFLINFKIKIKIGVVVGSGMPVNWVVVGFKGCGGKLMWLFLIGSG